MKEKGAHTGQEEEEGEKGHPANRSRSELEGPGPCP